MENKILTEFIYKYYKGKKCVDWESMIEKYIIISFNNIKYELKLVGYNKNTKYITLILNNEEKKIEVRNFLNLKLNRFLGIYSNKNKYNIKEVVNNKFIITELKVINGQRCYKYICKDCGYNCGEYYYNGIKKEDKWVTEFNLSKTFKCPCCSNKITVKNINSIYKIDSNIAQNFANIEDSYCNTPSSRNRIIYICPTCKCNKEISINNLFRYGFKCNVCNDNISYPEKVMSNLLKQLRINFKTQLSKKVSDWCDKYKYDFYFEKDGHEYIIETNGMQHYKTGFKFACGRTLEEEQDNDRTKKELAIKNGIKEENYIVIDCRKSELDFIKQNIIHSKLNEIFDLSNIDWNEIDRQSQKSLVKEVCDYYNSNINITLKDIGIVYNCCSDTVSKYLNTGNELGWCNYKSFKNSNLNQNIEVCIGEEILGVFKSASEISRISEELFGVNLNRNSINRNIRNNKSYKGFTFKYA